MSVVYDYHVSFIGDDLSMRVTVTETKDDIDHDVIIAEAEKLLCEMWGVSNIPDVFIVEDVEVEDVEL